MTNAQIALHLLIKRLEFMRQRLEFMSHNGNLGTRDEDNRRLVRGGLDVAISEAEILDAWIKQGKPLHGWETRPIQNPRPDHS